jgi:hypothetical protein
MTLNIEGVPFITSSRRPHHARSGKSGYSAKQAAMQLFYQRQPDSVDTLNGWSQLTNGNIRIVSKEKLFNMMFPINS